MVLQLYDYSLMGGILLALITLYFEFKALFKVLKSSKGIIIALAIFGILFFVTALLGGSAITGYATKDILNDGITSTTEKLEENNLNANTIKEELSQLKKNINTFDSSEEKEILLDQINELERKLDNLLDNNEELEEELDDLKNDIKKLYTLIPTGGPY